jgi:hypothetical protein
MVRQSKRKAKLRAQLSTLDAPTMMADGVLRDILRLDPILIHRGPDARHPAP